MLQIMGFYIVTELMQKAIIKMLYGKVILY